MKRTLALFLCFCTATLLASAQSSASAPKPSAIAGTVVKEPSSQPLKKVLVEVVAENQKEGGNYTASTDADGHFHIDSVLPGRYRIFLERAGFVGIDGRGHKSDVSIVTVQPGQTLGDLHLSMLPTAIITGRITDEDGDPMSGVRVLVQKKKPGKPARETIGTEATNDLGEYRLAGLFPGQYWIIAMPPPDFRDYEQTHPKSSATPENGNDPNAAQLDMRYLTTYYPGTYDALQASALTLKSGDEMPVNFTLVPSRAYRVRGMVTGVAPGLKSVVELISGTGDSLHANEVGADGQFEVRGVAPGTYMIRASAAADLQTLTARQGLSVVAADLEGVKLTPLPTFKVSGHLYVESRGTVDLTQYSINLRQADVPDDSGFFMSPELFGANAPVDRLGNFEWKTVNPGTYIVQIYRGDTQSNLFLKSARIGGRDIQMGFTANGPLTLDLLESDKGGVIAGVVVGKGKDVDDDHPVPNATVVAVPEEKFRKLPDRFGTGASDQHGRFTIRGLTPGSYTLYAWQDIEDGVYRDADFLKSQEASGTAVKIEEGSSQPVQLKLSPVPEEWR